MPCSKGMRACHSACAHRAMVRDYQDARDAYEVELEAATALYPTEVADYKRTNPGITFRAWLEGIAGRNTPPS